MVTGVFLGRFFIACQHKQIMSMITTIRNAQRKKINKSWPIASMSEKIKNVHNVSKSLIDLLFTLIGNACDLRICYYSINVVQGFFCIPIGATVLMNISLFVNYFTFLYLSHFLLTIPPFDNYSTF